MSPAIVAAETALAAVLGAWRLGAKSVWLDEAATAQLTQVTWANFWHVVSGRQVNMAVYYLLMRPWTALLGTSEVVLRAPSVLAFALTVPVLVLLGRRVIDNSTGLVAGALFALSPFALHYAQEARAYSLVCLLATLSTYAVIRVTDRDAGARRWWAIWVVSATLLAYSHILAVTVIGAQVLAVALRRDRAKMVRPLVWAAIAIGILLAPLAVAARGGGASEGLSFVQPTTLHGIYLTVESLLGGHAVTMAIGTVLGAVGCVAVLGRPRTRAAGLIIVSWAIVAPLLVVALSLVRPLLVDRYLIGALPGAVLLIAAGVTAIRPRPLAGLALAIAVGTSAYAAAGWYSGSPKENWRAATSYMLSSTKSGDAIIFDAPYVRTPFLYYASSDQPAWIGSIQTLYPAAPWTWGADLLAPVSAGSLEQDAAAHRRIWLVVSHEQGPRSQVRQAELWLRQHYRTVKTMHWTGIEVQLLAADS